MNAKVSIIVPVYKAEKFLVKCVESILNQTYADLEVILVDDGSPDECPALCNMLAERDSRVKVLHQENRGVSAARNAGLNIATGAYIGFVDSDDWIKPDMYELLLKQLLENGADVAACGYLGEGGDGTVSCKEQREALINLLLGRIWTRAGVTDKIFRIEVLSGVRFAEGILLAEDSLFVLQTLCRCKKMCRVASEKYYYRKRAESVTNNICGEQIFSCMEATEAGRAYMRQQFPEDIELQKCAERYAAGGYDAVLIEMYFQPKFRKAYMEMYWRARTGIRDVKLTTRELKQFQGTGYAIYVQMQRLSPILGMFLYFKVYLPFFKRK